MIRISSQKGIVKVILGLILCVGFLSSLKGQNKSNKSSFIRIEEGVFTKEGNPYHFLGTNLWYGLYLGADKNGEGRERLKRELDQLESIGIKNLRIMAGFEGPESGLWRVQPAVQEMPGQYNEALLEGLDYLMVELARRDITAVICLNNFFQWSGGMAQYVNWVTGDEIPYPHDDRYSWDDYQKYSALFFSNKKAQRYFKRFMRILLNRKNTLSGKKYKEDPTILAWQLANEPRGYNNVENYLVWVDKTAAFLQKKDKNHLVSLGGEGTTASEYAGTEFDKVMLSPHLDYLTAHIWIENWSWYNPKEPESTFQASKEKAANYIKAHLKMAAKVDKPIVFEEFGISRDNLNYDPKGTTQHRDEYYTFIFQNLLEHLNNGMPVGGSNFWSWGGEGRPKKPGGIWSKGDPWIGDPPHELQGWYSVFDKDASTINILKTFAKDFNGFGLKRNVLTTE